MLPDGPLEFSGEVRALLPLEGHEGVSKGFGSTYSTRKEIVTGWSCSCSAPICNGPSTAIPTRSIRRSAA